MAKACEHAASGTLGMEMIKFYSSDGHEYELIITRDVSEDEWQTLPVPYEKSSDPAKLVCIKNLDSTRKELAANENS